MSLLLVTTDYPPEKGGLQAYSYMVARALGASKETHLLLGHPRGKKYQQKLRAQSLWVSHMRSVTCCPGTSRLQAFSWSTLMVPKLRRRYGIRVTLHMQWSTAPVSWLLSLFLPHYRYWVFIHGAELLDPGRPWLSPLKRLVFARAASVTAGSRAAADLYTDLGMPSARLNVMHYPLPTHTPTEPGQERFDASRYWESGGTRLLCVHRLVSRKGTALLLHCLASLKHFSWHLCLAGDGPERSHLKELSRQLGIEARLHWAGAIDERTKMHLLREAQLFILPSLAPEGNNHFEGLGLVLLEAQAAGTPVLAARTGGIPEALSPGTTGHLFEAGSHSSLAGRLEELLRHPSILEKMGIRGPDWVNSRFSPTAHAEKIRRKATELLQS